jgi:hypothetical protein
MRLLFAINDGLFCSELTRATSLGFELDLEHVNGEVVHLLAELNGREVGQFFDDTIGKEGVVCTELLSFGRSYYGQHNP